MHLLGGGTTTTDGNDATNDNSQTSTDSYYDEPGPPKNVIGSNGSDNSCGTVASDVCRLRDVITQNLLVEYAKLFHDGTFDLATHPIILRNLWPPESFDETVAVQDDACCGSSPGYSYGNRKLTPEAIMNDPQVSNILLPNYFSDAANKIGYAALVPDSTSQVTLSQFLIGLLSGESPNSKIGTQLIIELFPELKNEIIPPALAKELFGWNTVLEDCKTRIKDAFSSQKIGHWVTNLMPPMSYFPVFIAKNQRTTGNDTHPRTDLHAEPIGNIASQLHGMRRWTLVPTMWSGLLRPTVSRHWGYFFSNIDPLDHLPERLNNLPLMYRCITRRGDSIWIPPWVCAFFHSGAICFCILVRSHLNSFYEKMWHRVDYDGDVGEEYGDDKESALNEKLSIGASIFHFYPTLYIQNFPLFSFLIIPNMIKELFGFNIE